METSKMILLKKNMKNLLFLLFLSFIIKINAQNSDVIGDISYHHTINNNNEIIEQNYNLIFNRTASYYEEIVAGKLEKGEVVQEDGTIFIKTRGSKLPQYYLNKLDGGFYFDEIFYDTHLFVKDSIDHKWNLTNETKKINGFICEKANGKFRGREFTAWFTNDIKTPFGPWKLFGLPGLIIEAYDNNGFIKISATNIIINSTLIENKQIPQINLDGAISLNKYFLKKLKLEEMFLEKLNSRMPKGSKPIKIDRNCKDCGKELEDYNAKN